MYITDIKLPITNPTTEQEIEFYDFIETIEFIQNDINIFNKNLLKILNLFIKTESNICSEFTGKIKKGFQYYYIIIEENNINFKDLLENKKIKCVLITV